MKLRHSRYLTLTLITLAAVLGSLAFRCGDSGEFTGSLHQDHEKHTALGSIVYSAHSINSDIPAKVDEGLTKVFRIASQAPNNYAGFMTSYTVWLFPRSSKCENPGFVERLDGQPLWPDGYDNDPNGWDKDPRVGHTLLCVAGAMVRRGGGTGPGDIGTPGMVVVDDVGIMATIIRYEAEHNILLEVDQGRFAATQYHTGTNGGHPIMPDTDGTLAATSVFSGKTGEITVKTPIGEIRGLVVR